MGVLQPLPWPDSWSLFFAIIVRHSAVHVKWCFAMVFGLLRRHVVQISLVTTLSPKQLQLLKLSRNGGFWIMTEGEGQELISETASSFRDGAFRFVHGCQGPGYPMDEQVAKAELVLDCTPLPPALQKMLPSCICEFLFCACS